MTFNEAVIGVFLYYVCDSEFVCEGVCVCVSVRVCVCVLREGGCSTDFQARYEQENRSIYYEPVPQFDISQLTEGRSVMKVIGTF